MQRSDIAAQAQPLIDGGIAPTLAVGVIDGETTHRFEHGADPRALFEIGSITKVFTGTLLADMVREGLLAFDDAASKYLPASVTVPSLGGRSITLSDLVTHTSGLPRLPANMAPESPKDPYADYTAERLYQFLSGHTLARAPGDKFEYSNLGMMLLGHVLSERAGKSYGELLEERICAPLSMKDTVASVTPELRGRVANGYDSAGDVATAWTMSLHGPGNLLSTVDDLLRFLAANMAPGATRLSQAMADARAVRFTIPPPVPIPIGALGIGCGWMIGHKEVRWHNGGTGGYSSFAALDVDARRAVVVLCGTLSSKVDELGYNLMRLLDGEAPAPPRVRVAVPVDPRVLEAYAGKYALDSGAVITVTVRAGTLCAQRDDQEVALMCAASDTRFFHRLAPVELSFVMGDDGQADHLVVHAAGDHVAKRIR